MGAPTDKFLDFCGTRLDEAMAERGSGRGQSAEARRHLTTDDLQKYIADATGKMADKISQDLTLALQESKSELQGVKQRLQGLEDRVSQLSDRLNQVVDAQAGNVTVVAGSAKQGTQETADTLRTGPVSSRSV